jgi:hypothetical protein
MSDWIPIVQIEINEREKKRRKYYGEMRTWGQKEYIFTLSVYFWLPSPLIRFRAFLFLSPIPSSFDAKKWIYKYLSPVGK